MNSNAYVKANERAQLTMHFFDRFPKHLRDKINYAPVCLNVEYLFLELFEYGMHKDLGISAEQYIDRVIKQNSPRIGY